MLFIALLVTERCQGLVRTPRLIRRIVKAQSNDHLSSSTNEAHIDHLAWRFLPYSEAENISTSTPPDCSQWRACYRSFPDFQSSLVNDLECLRAKMTRITPRTCLWPLAGSLVLTFSLSVGLTFRSNHHCFAATCGEWAVSPAGSTSCYRLYFWLAISVTVLAIRAFHPSLRTLLSHSNM